MAAAVGRGTRKICFRMHKLLAGIKQQRHLINIRWCKFLFSTQGRQSVGGILFSRRVHDVCFRHGLFTMLGSAGVGTGCACKPSGARQVLVVVWHNRAVARAAKIPQGGEPHSHLPNLPCNYGAGVAALAASTPPASASCWASGERGKGRC